MPTSTDPLAYERSLRASRERRAGASRQRLLRLRVRAGLAVAVASLTVLTGGALAAPAGETVAVQRALGVSADGIPGPRTLAAIRAFQREHGLVVDGIVGPQTRRALGLAATPATPRRGAAPAAAGSSGLLARIAQCESGGEPTAVSASGTYRGKYQFHRDTWRAVGGTGDPAAAPEAEQDRRAAMLLARQGAGAWPNCAG